MQRPTAASLAAFLLVATTAHAAPDRFGAKPDSPVRGIEREGKGPGRHRHSPLPRPPRDARSYDGSGNHPTHPDRGAAFTPLLRLFPSDYGDGESSLAGAHRPGPRTISNAAMAQHRSVENTLGTTDMLWQWGQFLDHDLSLSEGVKPAEPAPIPVPMGDPFFDPDATGEMELPFNRSIYGEDGGVPMVPRQQLNEITSYIDASNVYGSDEERAAALRTLDGSGRLKTSAGNLLPYNEAGLPNAGGSGSDLFLAGDVRANEQAGLAAMHTLFVREHNRLVRVLARRHPHWDGERLYQKARQLVGAQMQVITYREFLPALLGRGAIPRYRGYDSAVDPSITNAFSAAAYRFGHSALSPQLLRIDRYGHEIPAGHLALRHAFFSPERITEEGGIEPLLRGLAAQRHQRIDLLVIDDVRNFLFGGGGPGFDLAALNIQRGRDHGLPSYNDAREAFGMPRARSFDEIANDPRVAARLAAAYDHPDDVDMWVGCLSERPRRGSHLGALGSEILIDQFVGLRDGDRYWYTRVLTPREIASVERTRLSTIIRRNTRIGRELPHDVFSPGRRTYRPRPWRRPAPPQWALPPSRPGAR